MAYQFTDDLKTGNPLIDAQHKSLFEAINNLLTACAEGHGREQIKKTANFLLDYTKRHFGDEENLQMRSNYPDIVAHKRMHAEFTAVAAGLIEELNRDGANIAVVAKINKAVSGWLINHIKREDAKIAAHLKKASF